MLITFADGFEIFFLHCGGDLYYTWGRGTWSWPMRRAPKA